MDEYRKPFEYNEEKKGLILVFIIMLLVVDTLQTFSLTAQVYKAFEHIPVFSILFVVTGIMFTLFTLYTVILCSKLNKKMVKVSKIYLIVRGTLSTIFVIISFVYTVNNKNLIGNGMDQYKTVGEMMIGEIVIPFAYIWVFSFGWFLYFVKSKRCRDIVKE